MIAKRKEIARTLDNWFGEKIYHPIIKSYIDSNNLYQRGMSDALGISIRTFLKIYQLRWLPGEKTPEDIVGKLCSFFNCSIGELFPEELTPTIKNRIAAAEYLENDNDGIISYVENIPKDSIAYVPEYLSDESFHADDNISDFIGGIPDALCVLNKTEFKALTLLFGLNGKECRSIEQTAKYLARSIEEVVSIKEISLRKLRRYFKEGNSEGCEISKS